MKKMTVLILLMILAVTPAFASDNEGRSDENYFKRVGKMEGRGIMNIVQFPCEITHTTWNEMKKHNWIWPVTFIPRMLMNGVVRGASMGNDILISPFSQIFTNDTSAYTEHFGQPDYACETREESI